MNCRRLLTTSLVLGLTLLTASADAYTLGSARYSGREITALGRGVKEIGLDNILVLGYDKFSNDAGVDVSEFRMTYLGGLTFRYFVVNNLALTLQVQGLYKKAAGDEGKTFGVLGAIGAAYYMRLGHGLFLSPGAAAGGYWGKRETTVGSTGPGVALIESRTAVGGLARFDFSFVYYIGPRFNLRAGPEFIFLFGSLDTEPESISTFQMDGGFKVGFSYVF